MPTARSTCVPNCAGGACPRSGSTRRGGGGTACPVQREACVLLVRLFGGGGHVYCLYCCWVCCTACSASTHRPCASIQPCIWGHFLHMQWRIPLVTTGHSCTCFVLTPFAAAAAAAAAVRSAPAWAWRAVTTCGCPASCCTASLRSTTWRSPSTPSPSQVRVQSRCLCVFWVGVRSRC
jgi:hypothetical protein